MSNSESQLVRLDTEQNFIRDGTDIFYPNKEEKKSI